jgi:PLP dependent protein
MGTIINVLTKGAFMSHIKENIGKISEKIQQKKASLGISHDIRIVAVTKTHPASLVREAIETGLTDIGENRVQEAEKKFLELGGLKFTKHLIGHLQENKVNKAASLFDMVQSMDSLDVAAKLDRKLKELGSTLPVLIELNTSGDISKFGIQPGETEDFTGKLLEFSNLRVSGLMTIGPFDKPLSETRKCFRLLYETQDRLKTVFRNVDWKFLSMGMSDDYEIAIEEGSNMLRLGRILFGDRE